MTKRHAFLVRRGIAIALFCLTILVMETGILISAIADPVDDYIHAQITTRHMPGVSVAVVRNGKLVKTAGYGCANVETRAKATSDSLYVIASMTKAYAARLFDFGWGKTGTKDHRSVWSGGGLYGHTCFMVRFIDDDITVIVLTNFADGAPDQMARHIAGLYIPALAEPASTDEGRPTGP